MKSLPKPSDFPIGSSESRAAARILLNRSEWDPGMVITLRIVCIAYDGKEPLPPPQRILWEGGRTEIIHVGGDGA
jgi:hypothetical protein